MKPLHISLNTARSGWKPSTFISSFHTFIPSLPPSTRTSHPCHHHISTGRHPIIPTLTFHMPKPPQSTPPHYLIDALCTQKTVQIHTAFSYPSAKLCTSISPSSVPFSPDFADSLSSSPRFQSHMSMHSRHKPSISFSLCGMMHPELSG